MVNCPLSRAAGCNIQAAEVELLRKFGAAFGLKKKSLSSKEL